MADLTIRTPQGSWLNICESEWYVRQRDNSWTLIDPVENEIRVRDSSNSVWLDVTCGNSDANYCPPEAVPECWPGFSGDFDGGRVEGGRIVSCGGETKTYSGMTDALSAVGGNFLVTSSYSNGYLLPLTWAGGQAQVNEISVNPGPESGQIFMSFDPLGSNARLRVYQGCNLLADSNQQGFDFGVMYIAEDGPLFFRVDATQNAKWLVKSNYVNTDILTSFSAKAPCFGTFGARMRCIKDGGIYDGKQAYEAIHAIARPYSKPGSNGGASAQTTVIDYNFSNPGTMRVFHGEREVASAKNVTGFGQLQFIVDGTANDNLIVRVEASDSIWNYSMYCAGQCGSFYNRCTPLKIDQSPMCSIGAVPSDTIIGAGAPQTTVYVDYSQTEGGKVYLVYKSDDEVQFIVYVNGVVVAGSQPQVGENSLTFEIYDSTDEVKIVVIGPCCPSWQFTITDAVPDPSIFIADATITRPAAGKEAEICFPITLEYGYDEPIYLEYRTSPMTAYESAGASQLQFTPQSLIASNQVVSSFYEIYGSKVVVDAGIGRFKNGVITTGNRKYWQNMHSYLSEGRNSLIIVTGAAGTECSIGTGANQIPNNGSTVIHYTSGNLNITYESLKDYEAVFLLSTHTTTGTGLQSSRLSTVTFRSILSFADSGRGLFLGCIDGSTASGVNSFSGYLGMEVRGRYSPAATTEDSMNSTLGYHEVRSGIGNIALGTTGAVVTSAINRGAEVENYCFEIGQGGGPANVIPTDYKQTSGTLRIEPCQTTASICVPVCGSDLVGPDVHFRMNLIGSTGGFIADPYAVGTIKNNNVPKCEQNTSVAVKSNGLNYVVGRGAQGLYVDNNPANAGFQAVMDTTLTLNHASSYKFIFFGTDVAEVFVDCALIVRSSGGNKPTEATVFLYNGNHHLYINYYTNQGNTKSEGYAALAILDANNIVVHISTPAAYRGRVINAGKAPECTQFPDSCSFTATHGVSYAAHGVNLPAYPQAQPIQSDAHPPMCAPANTKYLLRKTIDFPVTGTYQVMGTGDDDIKILVDCKQVHSATFGNRPTSSFHATAGPHSVVIEYENIPDCTPGNACFVLIQPGGNVFYQSNPEGWESTQSALPQPLYQSTWAGHPVVHISPHLGGGGTNYSWWCAERNINVPETGDYYIVSVVDDDFQLFIGCKRVSSSSINESWRTRETFRLTAGVQKMSMRVYNLRSDKNNYVGFRIYRVGTNELLYRSTAAGWTAARRDLDLSGMSN